MKLYLIRHGETVENRDRIVQGHIDGTLTEKGVSQAEAAAEKLKDYHFDKIFTSDLGRALETAKIIRKNHQQTPFVKDARLREINFGDHNGKHGKDPKLSPGWEAFNKDLWNARVPNGESNREVRERVLDFINELLEKKPDGRFLLVTHGGPMRHVQNMMDPSLDFSEIVKQYVENTEVMEYEINDPLNLHIK